MKEVAMNTRLLNAVALAAILAAGTTSPPMHLLRRQRRCLLPQPRRLPRPHR